MHVFVTHFFFISKCVLNQNTNNWNLKENIELNLYNWFCLRYSFYFWINLIENVAFSHTLSRRQIKRIKELVHVLAKN